MPTTTLKVLWEANVPSQRLYFVERGTIDLVVPYATKKTSAATTTFTDPTSASAAVSGGDGGRRISRISAGGTCGELGFFLATPQVRKRVLLFSQ